MGDKVPPGWRWDDDWRKVKYLEWLTTPHHEREPRSQSELAALLGVERKTLYNWSQYQQFRDEWQRRVTTIIGDPSRGQQIMDTLFKAATDPRNRQQVQAAKLYLEATHAIAPPKMEVTVKGTTDLSDDELDQLIALGAQELRQTRDS